MASLAALAAGPVRAAGQAIASLDYHADPALGACPTVADFEREVTRQLGRNPFQESAPRRIAVRLFPSGTHTAGRVEWRDANNQWEGERTFSSRNEGCAELARAMALTTAIQLQLLGPDEGTPLLPPKQAAPPPVVVVPPVVVAPPPSPAPPEREPHLAVAVGIGVIQDFDDSPLFLVPRLAVTLGGPSGNGLRFTVGGLGPGARVTRAEGSAEIDRVMMTAEWVRSFRAQHRLQPLLTVGAGWQDVRVRGFSAMPTLGASHDGQGFSALLSAGGGLALMLAARLAVVVEMQALLYRPSVTIEIGSSTGAKLAGAAVFAHGGLLARF